MNTYTHTYVHIYICQKTSVYLYIYIYIYTYISIYACIFTHLYSWWYVGIIWCDMQVYMKNRSSNISAKGSHACRCLPVYVYALRTQVYVHRLLKLCAYTHIYVYMSALHSPVSRTHVCIYVCTYKCKYTHRLQKLCALVIFAI